VEQALVIKQVLAIFQIKELFLVTQVMEIVEDDQLNRLIVSLVVSMQEVVVSADSLTIQEETEKELVVHKFQEDLV
jgi:hypothetical protein